MGEIARGCYAAQLGGCSGPLPLPREHFVSKNILKEFEEAGRLQVTGYVYDNVRQWLMFVESMSAKVLCEKHNRGLSDVDQEGRRFLNGFFHAHTGLLEGGFKADHTSIVDGPLIERWMLKYSCGLIASGQAAGVGAERMERTPPPLGFLQVLFGLETLSNEWGLYTRGATPPTSLPEKSLGLALYLPLQPSGKRHVGGVRMEHYGFTSLLALKTPEEPRPGTDLYGAIHHPACFKLVHAPTGRSVTIVVNWPEPKHDLGFVLDPNGFPISARMPFV